MSALTDVTGMYFALVPSRPVTVNHITDLAEMAASQQKSFDPDVSGCMPPQVPVPKPGPCKGIKREAKAAVKNTAKKLASGPVVSRGRRSGPGGGRNLARLLNMESIAQLPHRTTVGNDERLAAISREQGFDSPARVVDAATLDKAVRDGGREMWRGVKTNRDLGLSPQDVHDQAATGPVHYGRGIFGNGIYFSDTAGVAATYGDNLFFPQDSVRRSVLDPRARTITYGELAEKMARDKSTSSSKYQKRAKQLLESLAKARNTADMRMAVETWQGSPLSQTPEDMLRTDPGAWAMSRGFDAILVPLNIDADDADDADDAQHEIVVLNRGALLTERRRDPIAEPEPAPSGFSPSQRSAVAGFLKAEAARERLEGLYGDRLHISGSSDEIDRYTRDLATIPDPLHQLVNRYFATKPQDREPGIHIGLGPVTEVSAQARTRENEPPRGWSKGKTFANVGGVFLGDVGQVVIGSGLPSGSLSRAAHEFGHAVDSAARSPAEPRKLSAREPWRDAMELINASSALTLNPYYSPDTNATGWLSESFAEAFAAWSKVADDPSRTVKVLAVINALAKKKQGKKIDPRVVKAVDDLMVGMFENLAGR